jgi:uncharacterized lipoprotein YmbA
MKRAIFLFLAACGSSAEPTFYALAPSGGRAAAVQAHVIEVRRPGLAGYLDRSDIVGRVASYRLRVSSGERWGEPLGDMIERVLAQDLAADARVALDVQRFELGHDGEVTLAAQVVVEGKDEHSAIAARGFTLKARPDGSDTRPLVATMSSLLGQLADRIALLLAARAS